MAFQADKLKKIFTNWKVVLLIITILLSIIAINPNPFAKGVAIRTVERNSSAQIAGIAGPSPNKAPMTREVITAINNLPVKNSYDYYSLTSEINPNTTVQIKTNKGLYRLVAQDRNGSAHVGLTVYDAPTSNIRKGLDLQGGTRVILEPERQLSYDEMSILIDSLKQRLNVYGLSDIVVRQVSDLAGTNFILVEIAGANEAEVKDLISRQGKFEAKISNTTVFKGGGDITYICRTAECSGLDPGGCGSVPGGVACRFRFSITLIPEAAQRQADTTKELTVIDSTDGKYLSETLDLYLDDQLVDKLQIGAELKGKASTEIAISGSGTGVNQEEAVFNSLQNMKRLQTILVTGSLPVKLNIVKTDSVSAVLGKEFSRNALIMSLLATLAVAVVLTISYRRIGIAAPIVVTMIAEIIILLGVAAIIGWNIDIAAIAGIIVAVGTGVDDQIVITDETLRGETRAVFNWKKKLQNAFFIIMSAYATMVVAMVPLLFAGAGLLKGFALTSIIGVTVGVFITRPAYAAVVEILAKE